MKPTTNTTWTEEVSCVLLGKEQNGIWLARLCWRQSGSKTSVLFDGKKTLAREESHGDLLGFYHTHPAGFPTPSRRDHDTMNAWCFCCGKPLLCAIDGPDGLRVWIYEPAEKGDSPSPREATQVELFESKFLVAITDKDA